MSANRHVLHPSAAKFRPTPSDWLVAGYVVAWLATIALLPKGPGTLRTLTNIAYFGMGAITIVARWRMARDPEVDANTHVAWGWLTASSVLLFVSGALWTAWAAVHPTDTDPGWSYWLTSTYMPCAIAGFLSFPRRKGVRRDARRLLDILLLTVGGFALSWRYSLVPLFADGHVISPTEAITVFGEWMVVISAAVAIISARGAVVRRTVSILLAAQVAYIFADYAFSEHSKAYQPGDLVDASWFVIWVMRWGAARYAWHARQDPPAPSTGADDEYRSGITPTAFVAGAYVALAFAVFSRDTGATQVAFFATVMTALLIARQQVELAFNKRLEREAAAQAHRFRAMLERASDYIAVLDAQQRVVWTSPSLGDATAARGTRFLDFIHPDDRTAVDRWLHRSDGRGSTLPVECRIRQAGGAWIEVALRGEDQRDDPSARGFVVNARDISSEVALEGRLRHAEKLATLHDMAGRIAHAFNNTLAMISGYAELLADQLSDLPQERDDLAAIRAAAERGAGITRQLLGFSGRHVIQPVRLRLAETVEALAPALGRTLPQGVTIRLRLEDRPAAVLCDRAQFEQVLVNLVTNARDAMPGGGEIEVSVSRAPTSEDGAREVLLLVRDSGAGIAEADLPQIFEPFFTTKAPGRGTGLGLAMVDAIVQRAGGRVTVRSTVGVGTTVVVHMPLAPGEPEEIAAAPEPAAASGRGVVLLVDDEAGVRRVGRRMLERAGFTVVEAPGGAEAIAIAESAAQHLDLLVTDMMMPEVPGGEVIARFRVLRPGVPIVVVTGFAALQEQDEALGGQVSAILAKPFSGSALVQAVAEALGADRLAES